MLNLLYIFSGHCHITIPKYTYIEHSKLPCVYSMVWCTVRLLRQICHRISLSLLQDCHVGYFYHVKNFKESNVQPIEQRMMDQRPCESGILLTCILSSQTVNVNNTSIRNVESTAVAYSRDTMSVRKQQIYCSCISSGQVPARGRPSSSNLNL